ncbi:hypothetical protein TWF718_007623 [Orbilia javanica]|uniref:F-box domain-containing protein n=1 Tax=Orbilia javanica TaxID=47235 RepID=A0AAN8RJ79_9PEZI
MCTHICVAACGVPIIQHCQHKRTQNFVTMPTISTFPTKLLIHIFSFLPWQDHLSASQVCKLWSSIFLCDPTRSHRYVRLNPKTALCPQMHNIFVDIGLECTINIFTGQISKIIFIRNEDAGISSDQEREEAAIDLTDTKVIKEQLFQFQGWRYEHGIREKEWKMGVCIMWNQRGYEYGSQKDRQFYRHDWFNFVKRVGREAAATNDILNGDVDLDISVEEFIGVLGKYILRFDGLKIPGKQSMRLRLGMYNRMGVIVIRNVHEASGFFDLSLDSLGGPVADKDGTWID